ncbi:hypothetical protein ABH906_003441 [Pseudomonas frederiksbergensis]|jgi:hypothetical protein
MDALRPLWDAERPWLHSHAERGNDQVESYNTEAVAGTLGWRYKSSST